MFLPLRWCRLQRLVSERPPGQPLRKARKLQEEKINEETYMNTREMAIPVILPLVVIILYITLGSSLHNIN